MKNILSRALLMIALLITVQLLFSQSLLSKDLNMIPHPKTLKKKFGSFNLQPSTKVLYDKKVAADERALQVVKDFAATFFTDSLGVIEKDSPSKKELSKNIFFQKKETDFSAKQISRGDFAKREYYHLTVNRKGIVIIANHAHGFFNAMQTFKQLCDSQVYIPEKKIGRYKIPALAIDDYPFLKWRGYMIDVSRHFRTKEYILKVIRGLALTKINVLHMHLSDDPGYRLESQRYPRITEVATRGAHTIPKSRIATSPKQYYTRSDVKEILEYARRHFIDVIPEIDIPGHSTALLRAYPEHIFTNDKGQKRGNVFNIRSQKTINFLKNLLSEVYEMFERPAYFHIGADEVNIKGMALTLAEQTKFCRLIADYLSNKYNTKIIMWNSHTTPHKSEPLPPNKGVIQYWQSGRKHAETYIKMGYPMINSWARYYYLDMKQARRDFGFEWSITKQTINGRKVTNYISPKYIYENASVYKNPSFGMKIKKDQLLGIEGPMWSETVTSEAKAEQKTFPRIAVIGEIAWAIPKEDDGTFVPWTIYKKRLLENAKRYKALGISNYFDVESL